MVWNFLNRLLGGNTLYYPGCLTKTVSKKVFENYQRILKKAGEDFILLSGEEACCGSPIKKAGYEEEFKRLVKKNKKIFREFGVKKIVTGCPACFHFFSKEYGLDKEGIVVEHMTQFVARALEKGKLGARRGFGKRIVYHDPCHLGRYLGVYAEPRRALEALGYEVVEMQRSRENALCCGGGGGLKQNFKELAEAVARARLEEAALTGVKMVVSPCPMCFEHMHENQGNEVKVAEFSEAVLDAVE